jgi:signal transduction histidine kinase
MGEDLPTEPHEPARGNGRSQGRGRSHKAKHAAKSPRYRESSPGGGVTVRGPLRRALTTVRDYLPRGNTLDQETFNRRHLLLCWVLGLHVPALLAFGVWQGFGLAHSAAEVAIPTACLVLARLARNRRLAAFFVTAGLVYCSSALVHLSNGTIEAHFHFFILIGLIALYQDWVPFLWNVMFTVLSHGLGSGIAADLMYNHGAAQNRPWSWAVIHGVSVLAACIGVIIFWKNTELEQRRNVTLVADIAAAEAQQRAAVSELLINLARRNQSLLNRQLQVITDLEVRERQPEVLHELFQLDHLATRIRRNAESLLVLSGDDSPRRWGSPVPLSDVVRAAAAEVEDYRRVEVLVNDHIDVAGRAVADLAHLLAELIENATTFSPPTSDVRVRSHLSPGEPTTFIVSVEDVGIGMSGDDLRIANQVLAEAPEVDLSRSTMLGFHVVARLSRRYGLDVRLAATPGGGLTALVSLPPGLVSERSARTPVVVGGPIAGPDRYRRAALAWSGAAGAGAAQRLALTRTDDRTTGWPELEPAPLSRPAVIWPHVPSAPIEPHPAPTPAWLGTPVPTPPEPQPAPWLDTPAPLPEPQPAPWLDTPVPAPPEPQPAPTTSWLDAPAAPPQSQPQSTTTWMDIPFAPAGEPEPAPATARPDIPAAAPPEPEAEPTKAWWVGLMVPGQPQRGPASNAPGDGSGSSPLTGWGPTPSGVPAEPSGLARRVPGTHLAASLRREARQPVAPPTTGRDRDRVRSMLSRFQASQRAGRAAAESPRAGDTEPSAFSPRRPGDQPP